MIKKRYNVNNRGNRPNTHGTLFRFWRKNKKRIAVLILALVLLSGLCFLSIFMDKRQRIDVPSDGNSQRTDMEITDQSIDLSAPLFTDEVCLIGANAYAFFDRDMSVPISKVISDYRANNQRADVGLPVQLNFQINGLPKNVEVTDIKVEVSENTEMTDARTYNCEAEARSVNVHYLKTGTQYYYRITVMLSGNRMSSVQGSFVTKATPRILSIDGAVNVRDIGGWGTIDGKTIQQGLLYRGGEIDGAVEKDYRLTEIGRQTMLSVLNIKTDMDLRAPTDNINGSDPLGEMAEHLYYNVPMYENAFTNTEPIRKVFADLADEDKYPVYLHCTYGADRTGVVCYLLEALLGVKEEDLMRDYQLTALCYGGVSQNEMDAFVDSLKKVEGETIQQKVERYLLSIDVTREELANIRNVFLAI